MSHLHLVSDYFFNPTTRGVKTRFNQIEIHRNGIVLHSKEKKASETLAFDTIEKIHLTYTQKEVVATYLYFLAVGFFLLMGLCFFSFVALLFTILLVGLGTSFLHYHQWIPLNFYHSYQLVIKQKKGRFFIQNLSRAQKEMAILQINSIKKRLRG